MLQHPTPTLLIYYEKIIMHIILRGVTFQNVLFLFSLFSRNVIFYSEPPETRKKIFK